MIDNCDMNLFDPEKMEIKTGKVRDFIPEYSKLNVIAKSDSTFCIEFGFADRDYEFNMSREQAVKLARGILTLSGEEIKQGKWIADYDNYMCYCSNCEYRALFPHNFCPNCGADMRGVTK